MRYLLASICIFIFTFIAPPHGYAQNTQSQDIIHEVQEIADWTESYFVILNDIILLFNNPEINAAVAAIEVDDKGAIREATRKYGENRRIILARMESAKNNMAAVPELKAMKKSQGRRVVKLVNAMNSQLDLLPTMYDEIAVASGHMETLLTRISKGDYSGVTEIAKQQSLALIRFLLAENLQVDAALLALEKNNPNYAFQLIVQAQNNIAIEELKMDNLSIDSDIRLTDRQEFNGRIKIQLDNIPQYITLGQSAQKEMIAKMKGAMPYMKTKQETAFIRSIISIINTFSETFNIEKEMYDMALSSYDLYISDKSSWEIEDSIKANDEQIIALAARRSKLMDERVKMLARQ